jgi:2',3'-cyclic-nucleotide 2'-phosphodiesterase (5'-nucleotidase family)
MRKWLAILLAAALLACALPAMAEAERDAPTSVTIFHTNDVHGRYNSVQGMGYAMMASFVNEARAAGENVLVFDAGDALHGTIFATSAQGESIINIMNEIGYGAMAAGNHDFNYGKDVLSGLSEKADFPILSATILNEDGGYLLTPYAILEVADKKIAVVGAQNPEIVTAIHPHYTEGLRFEGAEQVKRVVDEVRDQADAVIILCHWGANAAYDPNSAVLAAISGVDLVIDGHSHTALSDIVQVKGSAPVVSSGEYLDSLGRVIITFNEDGLDIAADSIANPGRFEDHALINAIEDIEAAQAGILDTVIGAAEAELTGAREIVRTQESNWGNLLCEIIIESTGADIALVNGGGIRASIPAGDITIRSVNETYPFGTYICAIDISGATLKEALEHGFSKLPEASGGFPQVGGMSMTVDTSRAPGERVTGLMIRGAPCDPDKTYRLATNDFLAAGGDGYAMLAECPMLLEMGFMDEVVISYIKDKGTVSPVTDGRITIK